MIHRNVTTRTSVLFIAAILTLNCSDRTYKSQDYDIPTEPTDETDAIIPRTDTGIQVDTALALATDTVTDTAAGTDTGTSSGTQDTSSGLMTTDTASPNDTVQENGLATDTDSAENTNTANDTIDTADSDGDTIVSTAMATDTEEFEFVFHSADFEQSDDLNGLVVIEAEDYTFLKPAKDGSAWQEIYTPEGYSGTGAMQATPVTHVDHKVLEHAENNAPVLIYTVNFVKAEPVYVWARASHVDGFDDSVWFGKNGKIEGINPISFSVAEQEYSNEWYHIGLLMDENRAMLNIAEAGIKTFEIYMREPGFKIDKIVLSTNSDYNPNTPETSQTDTGQTDGDPTDTDLPDAGPFDAGQPDGGEQMDAGQPDAG